MPRKPAKKRMTKTRRKVASAMREVHRNTPKIVERTRRKYGKARAEKQRKAIGLAKARRRGARIPKRKS